jgi:hypothetical protein
MWHGITDEFILYVRWCVSRPAESRFAGFSFTFQAVPVVTPPDLTLQR